MRSEAMHTTKSLLAAVTLVLAGCASGVRPDETTAEGHRREAARERELARDGIERHQQRTGTAEGKTDPIGGGAFSGRGEWRYPPQSYDPQRYVIEQSEAHSAHARAHEAAAAELERFEEAECGDFPPETRAACPILGPAVGFVEIDGGVRVTFQEGVSVAAAAAHMRCHQAFARAHGYREDCPLYMKGVHIAPTADGRGVTITTEQKPDVAELRHRAREQLVVGKPPATTL
jgi:hypothetical protein